MSREEEIKSGLTDPRPKFTTQEKGASALRFAACGLGNSGLPPWRDASRSECAAERMDNGMNYWTEISRSSPTTILMGIDHNGFPRKRRGRPCALSQRHRNEVSDGRIDDRGIERLRRHLVGVKCSRRGPDQAPRLPWPGRRRSARDHAHQNTVPAHEVMIKGGPDMHSHKARDGRTNQCVHHEEAIGQCAILRQDRRQFE